MNPYQKTLLWLGGGGILLAVILAALANAQLGDALFGDLALAQTLGAWADIFALVGVTSLVGVLVTSAVLWRPKAPQDAP